MSPVEVYPRITSKEGPLDGFFLASPPTKVKGREGSREEKATSALHKRQTTPL